MRRLFKKQIAVPQDHGSWVFILSPLLIGLLLGGKFTLATFYLVVAAMAAFLIRQPLVTVVKVISARKPRMDLTPAIFWSAIYGFIALIAVLQLYFLNNGFVFLLALPGLPIFVWYFWLVSRRAERRQVGVEILATGVLALSAPAAYWIGLGYFHPTGWWLWLLVWLQSSASIVYAYLRLTQRTITNEPGTRQLWEKGGVALLFTSFNLLLCLGLGMFSILPAYIFIPFLVQWLETTWGVFHPAKGWSPIGIGIRQLIVSTIWTFLFILVWRL